MMEFEVTGIWPGGTVTVGLDALADAMETEYFDEMKVGDSIVIKRIS